MYKNTTNNNNEKVNNIPNITDNSTFNFESYIFSNNNRVQFSSYIDKSDIFLSNELIPHENGI